MSTTTNQQRLKETFQDAARKPERAAVAPVLAHGPLAERRPDRSQFLLGIERIRPDSDQVRTHNKRVTDEEVRELAESIKAMGIEQPLLVRFLKEEDTYELIAGERRLTAAKLIGLEEVPVKLVEADEKTVRRLQLHENVHRASLTHLEMASALLSLLEEGETPDGIEKLLCKSSAYVQKLLTVGRQLSPAGRKIVEEHPRVYSGLDLLYEVAQAPADRHAHLLIRIKDERLTRDQLRSITAPLKEKAKAQSGTRRGRKPHPHNFTRRMEVACGATVSVTFRKAHVTPHEVQTALTQALSAMHKRTKTAKAA